MSLTSGERQALRWLLAVCCVGAGTRLVVHRQERDAVTPASAEALRGQLLAVDSAQRAQRHRSRRSLAEPAGGPRRSARRPRRQSITVEPATGSGPEQPTLSRVDVDQTDSAGLERLPWIGPALAARIIASRQQSGPFGSLDGLQRVRGIGPRLAARLAPHVTFSGTPRPSVVHR